MYLFNHIPKCGGLSYRALLEELFGQQRVEHISINAEEDYRLTGGEYDSYTVLMGHFGARWHDVIGPGRRWLTALREPADRVLSSYYFWRYNAPKSPDLPWVHLAQTLPLEDFVRSGHYLVRQGIQNEQTWQLADDLRWRYHTVPEQDALAVAKANLDQFDFIGIYEEFERSVERLCGYLGFAPPAKVPRMNTTRKRLSVSELSPGTLEAIMDLNRADLELYRYACEKVSGARTHSPAGDRMQGSREPDRMLPLPADRAGALRLQVLSVPAEGKCRGVIEASVEVVNNGPEIWSSAPHYPVFLSYHWLTAAGEMSVFEGWRSAVSPPLQPFSARRYRMHVLVPAMPGRYILRVTLVQELIRWFDQPPLACAEDIQIIVR